MLRIFILDDERSALTVLRHKLLKHFPEEVEIVGMCDDPEEALQLIPQSRPDLLMLDVEMPGMSGLELLTRMPERAFNVIFTTAYQHYAIEAIRKGAFDYLVKPIDESDLRAAIERALQQKWSQAPASAANVLALAQDLLKSQQTVPKLSVPASDGLLLIPLDQIVRLEGSGSYTSIYTISKQKIMASKNLSEYEDILNVQPQFFRCHKSHIISLNHVVRYIRGEGGSVIMSDGSEVEVARRRKEEFLNRL